MICNLHCINTVKSIEMSPYPVCEHCRERYNELVVVAAEFSDVGDICNEDDKKRLRENTQMLDKFRRRKFDFRVKLLSPCCSH